MAFALIALSALRAVLNLPSLRDVSWAMQYLFLLFLQQLNALGYT